MYHQAIHDAIERKDLASVQSWARANPAELLNVLSPGRLTPLQHAVLCGCHRTVTFLLEEGASYKPPYDTYSSEHLNDKNPANPLRMAMENNDYAMANSIVHYVLNRYHNETSLFSFIETPEQVLAFLLVDPRNIKYMRHQPNLVDMIRHLDVPYYKTKDRRPSFCLEIDKESLNANLYVDLGVKLGEGSFGIVRLFKNKHKNHDYRAVKGTLNHWSPAFFESEQYRYQEEMKIDIVQYDRESLFWLKAYAMNTSRFCFEKRDFSMVSYGIRFIMPYIYGLRLESIFKQMLDDQWIKFDLNLIFVIVFVLEQLHANQILHGDVQASNIIVRYIKNEIDVKYIDFGHACFLTDDLIELYEDRHGYFAPERCGETPIKPDPSMDVYSLGVMILDLLEHGTNLPPLVREFMCAAIRHNPKERPKLGQFLDAVESWKSEGSYTAKF